MASRSYGLKAVPIEKLFLPGFTDRPEDSHRNALAISFRVATYSNKPYEINRVYSFRQKVSAVRKRIIHASNPMCIYCRVNKASVVEHIIPVASGGTNSAYNLGSACFHCDHAKRSFTPREIGWKIKPTSDFLKNSMIIDAMRKEDQTRHMTQYREKHPDRLYLPISEVFTPLKVVNQSGNRVPIEEYESERREVMFEFDKNGLLTKLSKSSHTTFGFIKSSLMVNNLTLT